MKARALLAASLIGLAHPTTGKTSDEAVFDMSLEQLVNIPVFAVSRKQDSLANTPGIVTVIDRVALRELGVRTLGEALATVPGLFTFTNYFSVVEQVSIRGDLSDNVSNKILFTINGHPAYHAMDGSLFTDMMPVAAIERIEVVRGPVSVLYGTNALSGVINVVTRRDLGDASGEALLSAGSFGTREGAVSLAHRHGDWRLFATAAVKRQDGYDMPIAAEQDMLLGTAAVRRQFEQHRQLFLQLARGNLEIDLLYLDQDRSSKYGILPTLLFPIDRPFDVENHGIDLRYHHELAPGHTLRYTLRQDTYYNDYSVENYQLLQGEPDAPPRTGTGYWEGRKYGAEVVLDSSFEHGDLTTGLLWDEYRGKPVVFRTGVSDPFVLVPTDTRNRDVAAYANGRWRWREDLALVGGLRFTENRITGSHLDHRAGLVWGLSASTTLKLLYGTAYRSPTFEEMFSDAPPVIRGNAGLRFEVLSGLDLGLSHSGEHYNFSLNYFRNRTDDSIATRPDADGIETYTNLPGIKTHGLEWELDWSPHARLRAHLRGSWLLGVEDIQSGASLKRETVSRMLSAGLGWQANDHLQLDLSYVYNGPWLESPSYGLLNLAVYYRPRRDSDALELFLRVHNALDETYTYPEWQNRVIATIPGGPPRAVEVGIRMGW